MPKKITEEGTRRWIFGTFFTTVVVLFFAAAIHDYGIMVALSWLGVGVGFFFVIWLMTVGPDHIATFWNTYIADNEEEETDD